MKSCDGNKETLFLDVFEELGPGERLAWEDHLQGCLHCLEERRRLNHFIQRLKKTSPPPTISPERYRGLTRAIIRKLREDREKSWGKEIRLFRPHWLITALSMAGIVLVTFGWFMMNALRTPSPVQDTVSLNTDEQMVVMDLEVIKNLEILEEMETLEKLVRYLDHHDLL